jgi:hypothetical protein
MGANIVFPMTAWIPSFVGTNKGEIPVLNIAPDSLMSDIRFETMVEGAETHEIVRSVFSALSGRLHMMHMDWDA